MILGPYPSYHLAQLVRTRSYSEEECKGQRATKGNKVKGPLFLALSAQRAAGSEEKGQGWEAGVGGKEWVYQIPSRLPRGQQLAQGTWLERLFSERREAADLLGRRTPTQVSPE